MNIDEIIEKIKIILNNKNKAYVSQYYINCIEYISNNKNIDILKKTRNIENKYILEPLRLFLEEAFYNYEYLIIDKSLLNEDIRNVCLIRDLSEITEKTRNNLLRQLYVIETNNLDNFNTNYKLKIL